MPAVTFAKKSFAVAMLLMLSLLAGGCVRNAHAILKDDQVVANDALVGKWVSKDCKVSAELKPAVNNEYKLSYTNEDGKTGAFLVRFGKLGDTMVAEIRADAFNDNSSGEYKSLLLPLYSMIVIQEATPQQLVVTAPSPDWLKKFSASSPDELDVTSVGGQDLIVNSTTEEYQTFFLHHLKDKGMLGDGSVFVHPADPTTQPAAEK
jgi:hypothetical protein